MVFENEISDGLADGVDGVVEVFVDYLDDREEDLALL